MPTSTSVQAMVIGLPDDYRGNALEHQLKSAGIEPVRIDGVVVDHTIRENVVDDAASRAIYGQRLTDGEVGCALAHQRAYSAFLASGTSWTMILEDDTELVRMGPHEVSILERTLADPRPTVVQLSVRVAVIDPSQLACESLYRAIAPSFNARAYALNRAAAQILLRNERMLVNPADWPVWSLARCRFFVTSEDWFALREGAASTIGDRDIVTPSFVESARRWSRRVFHSEWVVHKSSYGGYRNFIMFSVRQLAFKRAELNEQRVSELIGWMRPIVALVRDPNLDG